MNCRCALVCVLALGAVACSSRTPGPDRSADRSHSQARPAPTHTAAADKAASPPAGDDQREIDPVEDKAELTILQRSSQAIPGSGGEVLITIGDITRGQTLLSIASADGETIHAPVSVSAGERVRFRAGHRRYVLTVSELHTALIGQDAATFIGESARSTGGRGPAGEAEHSEGDPLSEAEKIERLIERVARLDGAVFIRNGETHDAAAAAEHMHRKWEWKDDEIQTARDFIDKAASRSSLTGSPYRVRFKDGREVSSRAFLLSELERIERRGGG